MAVNVFEGARRIMKLVMVIIALTGLYNAVDSKPDMKLVYEIPFVGEKAVRIDGDGCKTYDDADEVIGSVNQEGNQYDLILCFKAHRADSREMLIPYEVDAVNKTWQGAGTYDDKVIQYTRSIKNSFSVSDSDEQFVNKQYWPKKIKAILFPLGIAVISIFGFWIFCWIVGWVVRGFAGIPMRQDSKK